MAGPTCTINGGSSANGVSVTAGSTITIQLTDLTSTTWAISCVGCDELQSLTTINTALSVVQTTRTATLVAGAAGSTYVFRSTTDGGQTTTFGVYVPAASGGRAIAAGETFEFNATNGWSAAINPLLRSGGAGANSLGSYLTVAAVNAPANYRRLVSGAAVAFTDAGAGTTFTIDVATGGITNAYVSASAAIAGSKITPAFGAQNISTTGTLTAGATTVTGALATTSLQVTGATSGIGHWDGSGNLTASPLVNTDVSATAAIAGTKIAPAFGAQTISTSTAVQIGAAPFAATGLLQVPNATTVIAARNAGNSADIAIAATDASNNVTIGDATNAVRTKIAASTAVQIAPALEVGSGNVASTGAIRLQNNNSINVRNVSNTADFGMFLCDTSNNALFGFNGANRFTSFIWDSGGQYQYRVVGATVFSVNSTGVVFGAPAILQGTNPSATGDIRAASTRTIIGSRNAGNTADLNVLDTTAADIVRLNAGVVQCSATNALGFYGTTPATKPTVTGSKGANAALTSLMTALAALGLVTDSTT